MKKLFITITLISIFTFVNNCSSQDFLKTFDYQIAEKILCDSVYFPEKLWKSFGVSETAKIDFVIIPVVELKSNSQEYNNNSNLTDYLKFKDNLYYALVLADNELIGFLGAVRKTKADMDKIEQLLFDSTANISHNKNLEKFNKWTHSYATNFPGESNVGSYYSSCFYNTIKEYNPEYYFMFSNVWELWFIDDNKLKAYSIYKKKIILEKELINGIRKVEFNGDTLYYLKYINE